MVHGCMGNLTDLKNAAVCQEWRRQRFEKSFHTTNCKHFWFFKETIRIDLVWEILKYRVSLFWLFMTMLFRKTCTAFLKTVNFNEHLIKTFYEDTFLCLLMLCTQVNMMFVMLLWVCIHTGQAEKFAWPWWESNPRPLGFTKSFLLNFTVKIST
jgi:hypothetical protein